MRNHGPLGMVGLALISLITNLLLPGCGAKPLLITPVAVTAIFEKPDRPTKTPTLILTNTNQPSGETGINPLTGLPVAQPELLERRPILIKVENLPRDNRPQFGLSLADLVYEYHTEEGTTRFAALFYGQNAEKVGPIRSARFFDINLIQMYKSIFVFGSAYKELLAHLFEQDFKERLILEGPNTTPALYRYEPQGRNLLLVNTNDLVGVIANYNIDNQRPYLDGMTFDAALPLGGKPGTMIFIRFSSAIYNRWDYDSSSGRYLRHYDFDNAGDAASELYTQAIDPLNGQPVAVDNVVVLMARNFVLNPGVFDIDLQGEGNAYIARDGQIFPVRWQRGNKEDVLRLVGPDGSPFPFKPGQTWFEVMSIPTDIEQTEFNWRFIFRMPEE